MNFTDEDTQLVEAAKEIISKLYRHEWQVVGTAIRSNTGEIITAVNVDANLGRAGVCAEAIALGKMISEEKGVISDIVSVYHPAPDSEDLEPFVVSPCGICREMLSDYAPEASVVYVEKGQIKKTKIASLLPGKYSRGF